MTILFWKCKCLISMQNEVILVLMLCFICVFPATKRAGQFWYRHCVYSSTHTHRWHCSWLLQHNAAVWIHHGPLPYGSFHQPACDCRKTDTHSMDLISKQTGHIFNCSQSGTTRKQLKYCENNLNIFVILQELQMTTASTKSIKLTWQSVGVLPQCPPASLGRWYHWRLQASDTPHPETKSSNQTWSHTRRKHFKDNAALSFTNI